MSSRYRWPLEPEGNKSVKTLNYRCYSESPIYRVLMRAAQPPLQPIASRRPSLVVRPLKHNVVPCPCSKSSESDELNTMTDETLGNNIFDAPNPVTIKSV